MKYSLLKKPIWIRSEQWHPVLLDAYEYGLGYYPMRRKSEYPFKRWNHMHLSNRR